MTRASTILAHMRPQHHHRHKKPGASLPKELVRMISKKAGFRKKTRTVTALTHKRKSQTGGVVSGVGGSFSAYKRFENHLHPRTERVLKDYRMNYYTDMSYDQLITSGTTTGFQAIGSDGAGALYPIGDLYEIFLQATQLLAGSTVTSSTAGSLTADVWHMGAKQKVFIGNAHNSPAKITIYDVLCKRDTPAGSEGPRYAWQDGLGIQQTNNLAGKQFLVDAKPNNSVEFGAYYRIAKRTQLILPAGSSHIHYVTLQKKHRLPNWYTFVNYQNLGSSQQLKDWYYKTLIVAHGLPVDSTASPGSVSMDQVKINVVYTRSYTYKVLPTKVMANVFNDNITHFNDPKVMLEESNTAAAGQDA